MKLTLLLIVLGALQTFATSFSQTTEITLDLKNAPIAQVFHEIEQQSDVRFLYINEVVQNKTITLSVEKKNLEEVLDKLRNETRMKFTVLENNLVVITPSRPAQQGIKITGKVVTATTSEALPGVNVLEKGTVNGTITDLDGNFSLTVAGTASVLVFSFVGYLPEEIAVGNQTSFSVSMVENIEALQEIVVVGYGAVRKIDLTGAVSSVKTKDIPIVATTSVDNMLQGRIAGMVMRLNSAQPGGRYNITVRGGNDPLYIIDGVPITNNRAIESGIIDDNLGYSGGVDRDPLNSINPSDIESIDVLKDASAAAIYGSAAADGVILITTKKGKAGKVNVEYRGSSTMQRPKPYFDLLDSKEFMEQHNRFELDQFLLARQNPPYGTSETPAPTLFFSQETIDTTTTNTDWLDLLMRNGTIQEHNLSVTAGNDVSKLFASFNYYGNEALLENSSFKRYSGRVNFDQKITKWLKFGVNLTFSQINANNASSGANAGGPEKYNMLQSAYVYSPALPVYDSLRKYSRTYDPKITSPAAFLIINDITKNNRFFANPNLEVSICKSLKFNAVGGIDKQTSNRSFYLPRSALNVQLPNGMAQLLNNKIDNYSAEAYFTFNRLFGAHSLNVVLGGGYYKSINEGYGLQAVDFFTDAFSYHNIEISSDDIQDMMNSYFVERTKISQFLRINYTIKDRYLFSIVGRNDGSSIFAENRKWGFFPGISAAWRINQEGFMKNVDFISDLKLRAGFGTAGNEGAIGNNPWKLYGTGYPFLIGSTTYPGVTLSQLDNPNLTWETDITENIGLDLGFFKNRITLVTDFYIKTKKDLLSYNTLPSNSPVGRIADNVGIQRSKGWELNISSKNLVGKFTWTTDFTISTYDLNWIERNPRIALPSYVKEDDPVYAVYGWKTDGLIKSYDDTIGYVSQMTSKAQLGNIKYVDINNDGVLDEEDVVMLDDGIPDWSLGLNNTFRFFGFDLNIYIYGLLGRKAYNGYRSFLNPTAISDKIYPYNTITDIKDVWSSDNPDGIYPGLSENSNPYNGSNPTSTNDFWLMDAGFVRIKSITLGYTLPQQLLSAIHFNTIRLYVDVQNLYVFTKYKGIDPELSDIRSSTTPGVFPSDVNPYPQALSITTGLNFSF
ncbi:MAG: SusC/RagA family TonB-linked outer membrane protein [Bacteroidales bacterium]|nr:SusC/RagA family TonB-linked outer membrane protein [Bacteroidales bacterium]